MYASMMSFSLGETFRTRLAQYRALWHDRFYIRSVLLSSSVLAVGVAATVYAGFYATEKASNNVTDIILSNTRAYDVDGLFVYGTFLVIAFTIAVCLWFPRYIPFTVSAMGLFYLTRSAFLVMTHIAPYPIVVPPDFNTTITTFFFGADLFFSGHTGAPFMLALIFWRETLMRYLFIGWSAFFATVVLLGHLHYTIDVASAIFITYTIYHIALTLFPRQYAIFAVTPDPFVPDGERV